MKDQFYKMCYTQFIEYLKSKGIAYTESEDFDIDHWYCVYTEVIPEGNKLKPRYFDNDGGHQLF